MTYSHAVPPYLLSSFPPYLPSFRCFPLYSSLYSSSRCRPLLSLFLPSISPSGEFLPTFPPSGVSLSFFPPPPYHVCFFFLPSIPPPVVFFLIFPPFPSSGVSLHTFPPSLLLLFCLHSLAFFLRVQVLSIHLSLPLSLSPSLHCMFIFLYLGNRVNGKGKRGRKRDKNVLRKTLRREKWKKN